MIDLTGINADVVVSKSQTSSLSFLRPVRKCGAHFGLSWYNYTGVHDTVRIKR
jgi:hypothetical protein